MASVQRTDKMHSLVPKMMLIGCTKRGQPQNAKYLDLLTKIPVIT